LNRGISGNRSVDLLARIKSDLINLKPDYLSLLIGVNDVWHELDRQNGVSAEKYEVILDMIINEVKTALPDIKILLLEPFVLPGTGTRENPAVPGRNFPLFDKEVRLRAAAAKRIAEKHGLVFVPLQEVFDKANADAPTPDYWLVDGVHPTAAGHELIKQAWLKGFEQLR
jgi:lysophospholipase L1-like esterase